MAPISCPECGRQVSDKAPSCPGCGYPLGQEPGSAVPSPATERPHKQPEDVLVTGPNGFPLREGLVGGLSSFIEWFLDVNLSDDDRDFLRQLTINEWSRNDLLINHFAVTAISIFSEFQHAPKQTREYWREVFLFRLEDVYPLHSAPMSGVMQQICERAGTKVRRKDLPLTRRIFDAKLKLDCFKAGVLLGEDVELESLPNSYKDHMWTNLGSKHPDGTVTVILRDIFFVAMWAVLPEPDKAQAKQMWEKEHSFLEGMVGIAKQEKQVPEEAQQASDRSLSEILVGKRWQAQSQTLAGQGLVITFMANGEFSGQLTGTSYTTPAQAVKGVWQVVESQPPQLFLDYIYNAQMDTGFTMQGIQTSAQIKIQVTQASPSKLLGVDQFARAWEWQRTG